MTPNPNKPDEKRAEDFLSDAKNHVAKMMGFVDWNDYYIQKESDYKLQHLYALTWRDVGMELSKQLHAKTEECERLRETIERMKKPCDHNYVSSVAYKGARICTKCSHIK